jgi:hypothetical protein
VYNAVRHSNNVGFSLRTALDERTLTINVLVNFIGSIWIHLYPANNTFQSYREWHENRTIANWKNKQPNFALTSEALQDIQIRLKLSP